MLIRITNDEGKVLLASEIDTDDVVGNPNSRGGPQSAQDRVTMIQNNLVEQVEEAIDSAQMDTDWRPIG